MNVSAFDNVVPSAAFAGLNPANESLADGIGSSYGVVGYKGKVWTLRLRGETYTFTRPDDGSPAAFLDVIVLRAASYKSKSYYPKDSFNDDTSAGQRPVCAALDGVNPDHDVAQPQAQACAICPRNEWKEVNGRKSRECGDYKRLAVLILPSQTKPLLGSSLMEPVYLRVPAASLNDLAILGEAMQKKGFHFSTYITRVGFQLDKPHPQMTFRALQALSDAEAPLVLPMREDANAYRITGENEVGKTRPAALANGSNGKLAAPVNTVQPATVQPVKPSVSPPTTTSPSDDPVAKAKAALAAAEAEAAKVKAAAEAKAKVEAEAAAKVAGPVDTGFGEVMPPQGKVSNVVETGLGDQSVVEVSPSGSGLAQADVAQSMGDTTQDTGPAEASDGDLDARVAALLQR
jgi:hypothetical protein